MDEFLDKLIDMMCKHCSGVAYISDKISRRGSYTQETNPNILMLAHMPLDKDYFETQFFRNLCVCYDGFTILNGNIDPKEMLNILFSGTFSIKGKIDNHFHNYIKPALLYFYENRDEIFLRHGLEDLGKLGITNVFPPNNSFRVITDESCYPIEIDRIPFGYTRVDKVNQYGFCSNHDWNKNWNIVKGFITLKDFESHHGKIINTCKRDHLYARSNINIDRWYFMYQGVNEDDLQVKYLRSNNICVIEQRLIGKFFKLFKLVRDKIAILNLIQT